MNLYKITSNFEVTSDIPKYELEEFDQFINTITYFESNDVTIAILNDYELSKVVKFVSKYATCSVEDISKKSIYCDDVTEVHQTDDVYEIDRLNYIFDKFRKSVLTTDDVLDKILEKGINSLDEFDKFVLSSY